METSLLIAAISAIVIMLLLCVLFFRQGKYTSAKDTNGTNPHRMAPVAHALSAQSASIDKKEYTGNSMRDELGISDIYEDIRKFMLQGIEAVFAPTDDSSGTETLPFTKKDISPETMTLISSHIAYLKNFRSEHLQLQKTINNPSVEMAELSKIILADPILAAKILGMANSSYFGIQKKIDSIGHALMIIGLQNIKNLLYRECMLQMFQAASPNQKEKMAYLWKHASIASVCASHLSDLFDGLNKGTLFTLGILHDIGKLVLLELPQGRELEKCHHNTSLLEEDRLFGINHAVIGQIVLEQWNFSELMINSVGMHHAPSFIEMYDLGLPEEQRNYALVLFIADQIAKLFTGRDAGTFNINSLLNSYHKLIGKNRLTGKVMDTGFLAQMLAAEAIVASEYQATAVSREKPFDNRTQIRYGCG